MNKKTLLITLFSLLLGISYIFVDQKFLVNKYEKKELNDFKNYVNTMFNKDFKKFTYRFENEENKEESIKRLIFIENKFYMQYKSKNNLNKFNENYNIFLKFNKDYFDKYDKGLLPYNKIMFKIINENMNYLEYRMEQDLNK